jgi:DNA-directed RNA polymerase subunit RPC12/RpoP
VGLKRRKEMKCPTCGEEMETGEIWLGEDITNTMLCNYCGELILLSSSVVPTGLEKIELLKNLGNLDTHNKVNEIIKKVNLIIDYLNQEVKK